MDKEILQKLVNESNSFSEILRKLGKSASGDAIKLLKEKLDLFEISYHFINERKRPKLIPLEDILVENRPYKTQDLKRRLIKEGLKKDQCECCGLTNYWNGKILTLQLDHINGNHNDNRLENLRVICPNCHSQTETFGNKQINSEKHCPDCGCVINHRSTYCIKCAPKHRTDTYKVPLSERPSKEELFELIKTKSFVDIGKMFGVADNTIKKWCKKEGIPSTKKELRAYLHSTMNSSE